MSWDLGLNARGDLSGSIVTKKEEVAQRVVNRLRRELGEWFLATNSGVPWYNDPNESRHGLLGMSLGRKSTIDLVLRTVILETEGVDAINSVNYLFNASTRMYSVYFSIVTAYGVLEQNLTLQSEAS